MNFRGKDLTGQLFTNQDLTDADFRGATLMGCDFRGATLAGALFQGANVTDVLWPDGYALVAVAPPPRLTETERLLEHYFDRDGRLTEIPVGQTRQRLVMEQIVQQFERGVEYPEKELNERLKVIHADFATLRRYLIDHQLMQRKNNIYWRLSD
jgi:hypothetical protein